MINCRLVEVLEVLPDCRESLTDICSRTGHKRDLGYVILTPFLIACQHSRFKRFVGDVRRESVLFFSTSQSISIISLKETSFRCSFYYCIFLYYLIVLLLLGLNFLLSAVFAQFARSPNNLDAKFTNDWPGIGSRSGDPLIPQTPLQTCGQPLSRFSAGAQPSKDTGLPFVIPSLLAEA